MLVVEDRDFGTRRGCAGVSGPARKSAGVAVVIMPASVAL